MMSLEYLVFREVLREITLLGDVCFKFSMTFSDASVLYLLTLSLASLLNYVCSP